MSVGTPVTDLPDGYISYGGSSNWWIYPDGTNAGAAIACHVPPGPNGINFGSGLTTTLAGTGAASVVIYAED